jgi:saccharopine dehydrogenase-like NADP-dependent oxidoreductase
MARTTALTCASFTRWAATNGIGRAGVVPLEKIGRDRAAFDAIVRLLREKGIEIVHEGVASGVE